jgi:hypothetical protein
MKTCERRGGRVAALACVGMIVASLSGCGFSGSDESGSSGKGSASAKNRPPSAGQADMVAAVSGSREAGLVDLKFTLLKRPKVGEPAEIELAITPAVDLERLFVRFQAQEGLQIVSGGETEQLENPARGEPMGHKVTILARADGIYAVTAVVLADSETESVARTFTIPVIAGEGLSPLPADAPAAASSVADSKRVPAQP